MSRVQTQIEIDAPVERVWDTVMDPDRLKDWVTIHRSVEDVSQRPLAQGSTMRQCLHLRGVSFHVEWKLVDVSEPHDAKWEGQGPARSRAQIRYQLSSNEDGKTVFKYTNEFTPPGGKLGVVASRVIVGAASEREAGNSLQRLKKLVEHD